MKNPWVDNGAPEKPGRYIVTVTHQDGSIHKSRTDTTSDFKHPKQLCTYPNVAWDDASTTADSYRIVDSQTGRSRTVSCNFRRAHQGSS